MVDRSHVGQNAECPHCFGAIQVPESMVVNKDRLLEPPGLRRILKDVRDQEWERLRRKLVAAKARIAELETAAAAANATLAKKEAAEPSPLEIENLRKQIADMSEKFVQANQAFTAGRKQYDVTLENLRKELDSAKEDAAEHRRRSEAITRAAIAANAEIEKLRGAAALADAASEMAPLPAKEATGGCAPAEVIDEAPHSEMDLYFAEILKAQAELSARNDSLRKEIQCRQSSDRRLEDAVNELESGIKEVVWTIAARREPSKKA